MLINIFLDDIRKPPKKYHFAHKTGEELLAFLKVSNASLQGRLIIDTLSLDHDLGEGVMDGYEFVKQFVDLDIPVLHIQFHTDNMIGFKNMYKYLENAKKHGLMMKETTIEPRKVRTVDGMETLMYRPL